MKKFCAALCLIPLLLAGCANLSTPEQEQPGSSQVQNSGNDTSTLPLDEAEKTVLLESAEMLTEAITFSTVGFSTELDPAANQLAYPSDEDPRAANQFVYLLATYQGNGYKHSIYAKNIYRDKDGVYHLSAEELPAILQDVLGITVWDPATTSFDHDPATQEYLSKLQFGMGYGWMCGEILGSQINTNEKTITVEFRADYLFPGASGTMEDKTSWLCKNTFSIRERADGELFLSFEQTEILP